MTASREPHSLDGLSMRLVYNVRKVSLEDSEIVHPVGLLIFADIVTEVLLAVELPIGHSLRVIRVIIQRK